MERVSSRLKKKVLTRIYPALTNPNDQQDEGSEESACAKWTHLCMTTASDGTISYSESCSSYSLVSDSPTPAPTEADYASSTYMPVCKKTHKAWEDNLGVPGSVVFSGLSLFVIYLFYSLYVRYIFITHVALTCQLWRLRFSHRCQPTPHTPHTPYSPRQQ